MNVTIRIFDDPQFSAYQSIDTSSGLMHSVPATQVGLGSGALSGFIFTLLNGKGRPEWPDDLPPPLLEIVEVSPGVNDYVFKDLTLNDAARFELRVVKRLANKIKFIVQKN